MLDFEHGCSPLAAQSITRPTSNATGYAITPPAVINTSARIPASTSAHHSAAIFTSASSTPASARNSATTQSTASTRSR